jgi:hypothetical protein
MLDTSEKDEIGVFFYGNGDVKLWGILPAP